MTKVNVDLYNSSAIKSRPPKPSTPALPSPQTSEAPHLNRCGLHSERLLKGPLGRVRDEPAAHHVGVLQRPPEQQPARREGGRAAGTCRVHVCGPSWSKWRHNCQAFPLSLRAALPGLPGRRHTGVVEKARALATHHKAGLRLIRSSARRSGNQGQRNDALRGSSSSGHRSAPALSCRTPCCRLAGAAAEEPPTTPKPLVQPMPQSLLRKGSHASSTPHTQALHRCSTDHEASPLDPSFL